MTDKSQAFGLLFVCVLGLTEPAGAGLEAAVAPDLNSAVSVQLVQSTPGGLEVRVEVRDLELAPSTGRADRYAISLSGESQGVIPGMPDLPVVVRLVALPPEGSVRVEWESTPPQVVTGITPESVPGEIDAWCEAVVTSLTSNDGWWPPEVVTMSPPAVMRGQRLTRVAVCPVQYHSGSASLRIYDDVTVRLVIEDGWGDNPVDAPQRNRGSDRVWRSLRHLVVNPSDLRRDDAANFGQNVYVIPNYQGVAQAIQPLVEWRRRKGYPTEVITVPANATNVAVKNAIQAAYDNWDLPPDVITLVGEADLQQADFMIPTWDVGRAYMWETDHRYVMLEGQDLLPEAAIGRISCRNLNELRRLVDKIVNYERDPYMADTAWFKRAALMSNDPRTGYSSIYVQRWARKLLLELGFAEPDTFYFIHDNNRTGGEFIQNNFNAGISLFNYRGWGQFNGAWTPGDSRRLRNGRMLPFVLMPTCNTADFADHVQFQYSYAEDFLWAEGGGIGAVGSSGFTHTNYNNVLDGGVLNGFYRDGEWQLGWALNRGKLECYRHFGPYGDIQDPQVPSLLIWEAIVYQTNLIGDAGTELWTGVPEVISVSQPDTISVSENLVEVTVTGRGGREVDGAVVTLLRDGELLRVALTDPRGVARFTFAPDELEPGRLDLTVSGHNLKPYLGEVAVQAPEMCLGVAEVLIDDDRAGQSRGNGDGRVNPGETLELGLGIANYGETAPEGAVELSLEPLEGDVGVVNGAVHWDQGPEVGDTAYVTFIIQVGSGGWDGQKIVFQLSAENQAGLWRSGVSLTLSAPDLEYVSHRFSPASFLPGDTAWVDVTLRNRGGVDSRPMQAELVSRREVITVFNSRAEFAAMATEGEGREATARFRLMAHSLTIPGTDALLEIHLQDDEGFRDTVRFSFPIGEPAEGTPFGPDDYGYGCFDDTDREGWPEVAPVFQWVEIDPDSLDPESGIEPVDTELNDLGNEQDWSVLVDLPFTFRYYGTDFNRLTICSNGWMALGDESKLADFQNRRIPPALGPRAQVCVFWDDLVNYVDEEGLRVGGVYYWFDEENHRFIVEWSRMRRYIGLDDQGRMRPGGLNTFEAILYDPQHYQTYTGDGDIVFQYRIVNNDPVIDPTEYDTPYATVGIVNLNGTDGLEYTYWGTYRSGAAPLQSGRAVKFSTRLVAVVGSVRGEIRDAATGLPIAGAEVRGNKGAFGVTDAQGRYVMGNVLIGDGYAFTAWAPGYNEAVAAGDDNQGFTVAEGETLVVNFQLLHPEFALSRDSLRFELQPEHETSAELTLSNAGNGPLDFRVVLDYPPGAESQVWNRLLNFDATAATGDTRLNGATFFAGRFWVTGENNSQEPNYFYRFDVTGRYIDRVAQPGRSAFGLRDVTVAGDLLYGSDGAYIYAVDADGQVRDSLPSPLVLERALVNETYGGDGMFWAANGRDEPLVRFDRDGNVVETYPLELDIYGLGWLPDDQEGFPLYILSRDKTHPALQVPEALVSKLNPRTGELRTLIPLQGELEDRAGGMEITNRYDPGRWVMVATMTNPAGDRVSVYDLGPNTSWIAVAPQAGQVEPGSSVTFRLVANSYGMTEGVYRLAMLFRHNARGFEHRLPLTLSVDRSHTLSDTKPVVRQFALEPAAPNPFNDQTRVFFSLPTPGRTELWLYDVSGRRVAVLADGFWTEGRHSLTLNGKGLPAGVYLLKLHSAGRTVWRKVVLVR